MPPLLLLLILPLTSSFLLPPPAFSSPPTSLSAPSPLRSSFDGFTDASDLPSEKPEGEGPLEINWAGENDDPFDKASVGLTVPPPVINFPAEPYYTALGETVEYDEDNVLALLAACRTAIPTLFGYTAENRGVGITGSVDYVSLGVWEGRGWRVEVERRCLRVFVMTYLLLFFEGKERKQAGGVEERSACRSARRGPSSLL